MKRHDFSKGGLLGLGVLVATAYAAAPTLVDNIQKTGLFAREVGCAVQTLTVGMVTIVDCDTVAAPPAADPSAGAAEQD